MNGWTKDKHHKKIMIVSPFSPQDVIQKSESWTRIKSYNSPPNGEIAYTIGVPYKREIWRCPLTGHFRNFHTIQLNDMYSSEYVDATYGEKMQNTFEKIINLPDDKSDNKNRVRRVHQFAKDYFDIQYKNPPKKALDVGSGLCVFLHELKKYGWDVLAMDIDQRQVDHATSIVKIPAVLGPLENHTAEELGLFDLISFNKVLEHIENPVSALSAAKPFLKSDGLLYVELPDGEAAQKDEDAFDREEFFMEHFHVFSTSSFCMLIEQAGFRLKKLDRYRDPSGKYSLAGFASRIN